MRMSNMAPVAVTFFIGFVLGGVSSHYASAQGLMGISNSVTQLNQALSAMEKNLQEFQNGMAKIKQVKEQLAAMPAEAAGKAGATKEQLKQSGDVLKQQGESVKKSLPGLGH